MKFYVKNCCVRVSFYFFALLCVAAFFDRTGMTLRGLLAAFLHECGHLAAMLLIPGRRPAEIALTPFGIRIESAPLSVCGRGAVPVLAAGSGVNFICTAVTFGFFPDFASVSFVLGALNLLPVEGMDGGGLLLELLENCMSGTSAAKVMKAVSRTVLFGMLITGITVLIVTRYNFTLIALTLALAAGGIRRTAVRKNLTK